MIMMFFFMVVIVVMIVVGGLGEIVLKGIIQMKIGLGFEGGIVVVILVIILDWIIQGMVCWKDKKQKGERIGYVKIQNNRKFVVIGCDVCSL